MNAFTKLDIAVPLSLAASFSQWPCSPEGFYPTTTVMMQTSVKLLTATTNKVGFIVLIH